MSTMAATGVRRRGEILKFVETYWRLEGYAPTVREVMSGCGYASPSAAAHQINILIELGLLQRMPGRPRTLKVVEQP